MNLKLLRTILVSTAITGSFCVSAYATSIGGATVTADSLSLRSAPSASASVIAVTPKGSQVIVGSLPCNNWYKVEYLGSTGYMSTDGLNFKEDLEGFFSNGKISGTQVRMLDGANLNANYIGSFAKGTEMQVIGVYGSWYKVKYGTITGYVSSDDFSLDKSNSDPTVKCLSVTDDILLNDDTTAYDDSALGQQIVDTAMKYLGTPYVWGGTTTRGFDCSGFVQYVYRECGFSINRTAAAIYREGTYVDKSELKVGDAICFASHTESVGHIGIYIGNGQFIHASSGAGRVVISYLDLSYYTSHYVGARHIV